MNSSEQCEFHPRKEVYDRYSKSGSSFLFPEVEQFLSVQGIHKVLNYSQIDHLFQDQCSDAIIWEDRSSNLPFKNEYEGKTKQQNITGLDESFAKESKTKKSNSNADKHENRLSNSNQLLREVQKICRNAISDDFSPTTDFEYEKDMFPAPTFDATLGSEDDISFCLDLEETDSEIQVAVNEIRKEAEKLNTILILEKFKSLKTEFDSVTKKYSLKTTENESLKIQLQESENRLAHMELERDLHQADATKLREDLKNIVSKIFDISMYESSECLLENKVDIQEDTISDQCRKRLRLVRRPDNLSRGTICSTRICAKNSDINEDETIISLRREKIRIIGLIDQPCHMICRLPLLSDPDLTCMKSRSQQSQFLDADTTLLRPSSHEDQPLRDQNVFRKRSYYLERRPRSGSVWVEQKSMTGNSSYGRVKGFRNNFMRHHKSNSVINTKSSSLVTKTKDAEKVENKRCGVLFRRRSKQQSCTREDTYLLKQQISQLHEMMKTSLASSGRLRKRLTIVCRYYEGVISKLRTNVSELNTEKSRMQVDLAKMVCWFDRERRQENSKLDCELHQKDKEITRLKTIGDHGEV